MPAGPNPQPPLPSVINICRHPPCSGVGRCPFVPCAFRIPLAGSSNTKLVHTPPGDCPPPYTTMHTRPCWRGAPRLCPFVPGPIYDAPATSYRPATLAPQNQPAPWAPMSRVWPRRRPDQPPPHRACICAPRLPAGGPTRRASSAAWKSTERRATPATCDPSFDLPFDRPARRALPPLCRCIPHPPAQLG
ncbi:MAG: hypothetical protein J3K34DRAFT_400139 [Monoraphidium minutum]|nr:MAG: hypothetical protein J3K34DRAFT_400139 [Monoraphidium minutum]